MSGFLLAGVAWSSLAIDFWSERVWSVLRRFGLDLALFASAGVGVSAFWSVFCLWGVDVARASRAAFVASGASAVSAASAASAGAFSGCACAFFYFSASRARKCASKRLRSAPKSSYVGMM